MVGNFVLVLSTVTAARNFQFFFVKNRNQTLFSGSLSRAGGERASSNNFHFSRISHTNHFPNDFSAIRFFYVKFFKWLITIIECGRPVLMCLPFFFQVFQFLISKIHSTIMWSPRKGPRNEAFRQFPTKPWNVEVFHLALLLTCALEQTRAWGRAKAEPFVCPFRSSNHGRPIVIYQSFSVSHIVLHSNQNTKNNNL